MWRPGSPATLRLKWTASTPLRGTDTPRSGSAWCLVVGIFPNDASITRLVGAMMLEQNDEWSLNRKRDLTALLN